MLWGLVEYQKRAGDPVGPPLARPQATVEESATTDSPEESPVGKSPTPVDLRLVSGLSAESSAAALSQLREERNLRGLTALESGRLVSELPNRTFFFLLGGWLRTWGDEPLSARIANLEGSRFRRSDFGYYELHKTQEGFLLVAFVTESDAARAAHLNGKELVEIVAAPSVGKSFTSLISVPVGRIVSARPREFESKPGQIPVKILDLALQ